MADSMITLSSKNYTQINPLNWDLHEINRYKDENVLFTMGIELDGQIHLKC